MFTTRSNKSSASPLRFNAAPINRLLAKSLPLLLIVAIATLFSATSATAQTTLFTYQGKLTDNNAAVNALYDFTLTLWDAPTNGNQIGSTVNRPNTPIVDGIFTLSLDFGAGAFNGTARYLEISIKLSGSPQLPTVLAPRQQVLSTPYAIKSLGSSSADGLSAACVNCINSTQIGSVNGSSIVGTIPPASLPGGSGNYIQNGTTQQSSSNFNISGNGTAAGSFSGNSVNATTQYNLNGSRILGTPGGPGSDNLAVGFNAGLGGALNAFFGSGAGQFTLGTNNSFFGQGAGNFNTNGQNNAFFGKNAGLNNTIGADNVFIGQSTGVSNTIASGNVFVGSNAGFNNTGSNNVFVGAIFGAQSKNTVGTNNTTLGSNADVATSALTFATAIGSGASVLSNNTIALGRTSGLDQVRIYGNGTVDGTLTAATLSGNIVNASTQFNLNATRILSTPGLNNLFFGFGTGLSNTIGSNNAFVGTNAGTSNTSGSSNSFFGSAAGQFDTTGSLNSFFGFNAGHANVSGGNNSYFGYNAGSSSTGNNNSFFGSGSGRNNTGFNNSYFGKDTGTTVGAGHDNVFFGYLAGFSNVDGSNNAFVGARAGSANTGGVQNTFFGNNAGQANSDGTNNAFVGSGAGFANESGSYNTAIGDGSGGNNITGSMNVFVGRNAGNNNNTGSNNTLIGADTAVLTDALVNATAIGYRAAVNQNNTIVLGSINGTNGATADTKVGIGTTKPTEPLSIRSQGNSSNGVWGWSSTNDDIVFGSKVGGMGAEPYGGWIGTKTNHGLSFFVNNGTALVTFEAGRYLHFGSLNFGVNGLNLCLDVNDRLALCSSSLRYKTDVETFTGGLDIVNRLRPIAFTWKEGGTRDIGFGAEEVDQVEPLLAFRREGRIEGVKYSQISAVLVNAIKEQQAQIESQQKQLDLQKNELALLKQLLYRRISRTTSRTHIAKRPSR